MSKASVEISCTEKLNCPVQSDERFAQCVFHVCVRVLLSEATFENLFEFVTPHHSEMKKEEGIKQYSRASDLSHHTHNTPPHFSVCLIPFLSSRRSPHRNMTPIHYLSFIDSLLYKFLLLCALGNPSNPQLFHCKSLVEVEMDELQHHGIFHLGMNYLSIRFL